MPRAMKRRIIDRSEQAARELEGVRGFLADLEAKRGSVDEKWRAGMVRHYERRRGELESVLQQGA